MKEVILEGRKCHRYDFGERCDAVILWGMYPHTENEEEELTARLGAAVKGKHFTLLTIPADDWNADFSPWPAPAAFGDSDFKGNGPAMLAFVKDRVFPYIRREISEDAPVMIAGYSLAGLFSLWAFYELSELAGAASCSGSLWMDGWDEYAEQKKSPGQGIVYLSLGGKEEQTRNKRMAAVGDRTRRQEELFSCDPLIRKHILEWNAGGHFADPHGRLIKGIIWLLENV